MSRIATTGPVVEKLSWEDTAREMAASREDRSAWDAAVADGLKDVPWQRSRHDALLGYVSME